MLSSKLLSKVSTIFLQCAILIDMSIAICHCIDSRAIINPA